MTPETRNTLLLKCGRPQSGRDLEWLGACSRRLVRVGEQVVERDAVAVVAGMASAPESREGVLGRDGITSDVAAVVKDDPARRLALGQGHD